VSPHVEILNNNVANDLRYLKLDASNDPLTGNLDLGAYDLTTTGTLQADGLVGLGGASPTTDTLVSIGSTRTIANRNVYSLSSIEDITITENQTGRHVGLNFDIKLTGDYNVSRTSGYGGLEGATFRTTYNGSGTLSKATSFDFWHIQDGGGTTTEFTYVAMGNPGVGVGGGNYGTVYGLKIGSLTAGVTANWAIYTDAGLVKFGDKVCFTQVDGNEYIDSIDDGYLDYGATTAHRILVGGVENVRVDGSTTAGDTRFMLYDVDNATLERVTVGAADSGGAGFKVLRIPN